MARNIFEGLTDEKRFGFAKRIARVSYESQIMDNGDRIDHLDIVSMIRNQYQLLDCPESVWKGVKASEDRVMRHVKRYGNDEEATDLLLDIGLLECGLIKYFGWETA